MDGKGGMVEVMEKNKKDTILSSTLARIVAFFVLAISFVIGIAAGIGTAMLFEAEVYTKGTTTLIHDSMTSDVWHDVSYAKVLYQEGDLAGLEAYFEKRNASIEIYESNQSEKEAHILLWGNYDGTETQYFYNCFTTIYVTEKQSVVDENAMIMDSDAEVADFDWEEAGRVEININDGDSIDYQYDSSKDEWKIELSEEDVEETIDEEFLTDKDIDTAEESITPEVTVSKELLFRVYIDDTFPYEDEYQNIYQWAMMLENFIYVIPIVAVICVFLCLFSFIYLMCSAGHHRGKEGITGGVLYFFHFDVVTAIFGVGAVLLLICTYEAINYGDLIGYVLTLGCAVLELIWCTIYCMELATELKKGTLFKHTLICVIFRRIGKGIKVLGQGMAVLVRGLPLVMNVVLAYIAFCIVQFVAWVFLCALWSMDFDIVVVCFLEKIVLFPIVLYFALVCKKLKEGSEALAEGNLHYKLNTSKMLFGFKEHGENLNRIGEGISLAVEERMRSEHLKTELITNVSHDLKTPLTSIINYADLMGAVVAGKEEDIDRAQLEEYSEVLVRQSKRLKKLLEDLVEASKATTGNLEVNLVPCEISVLLSQAVGEYEIRFMEKQLELIVKQPNEPVSIQADGRHIWRVFDNLMNNICKYAQENTRVYLTAEIKGEVVEIVFRNMSKYPLEISAEELKERFVRGDKSRHMEGNGLGLSIAESLVDLQKGKMEIVTDGDLFKVILQFPVL